MLGAPLRVLLTQAYSRQNETGPAQPLEIVGGPQWMDSDRYDVEAKADCKEGTVSRDQLALMVQAMLEDRFQLRVHLGQREQPVYNLVVAKGGLKVKPSADQTPIALGRTIPQLCGPVPVLSPPPETNGTTRGASPTSNAPTARGTFRMMASASGMTFQAQAVPLSTLASMLQQPLGRRVVDKTGQTGLFDFTIEFSRQGLALPAPPSPAGITAGRGELGAQPPEPDRLPPLPTALLEMGFDLQSARGTIDVLFVDSAQRPSEN